MYYPDIDSLHDLDASGLPIFSASASLADLFDDDDDGDNNDDNDNVDSTSLMRSLRKKMQLTSDINAISSAAHYRNVSTFARKSHFPIIIEELIDADGGPLLHLVEECPGMKNITNTRIRILITCTLVNITCVYILGKFYLSYLLPKNSILNERINALISQLNQAGLPSFWSQHIIHAFIVQKRSLTKEKLARNGKKTDGFVPFNLSDVQSSFYMLLIGLSISTIVFFHEKGWLKTPLLHTEKPNYIVNLRISRRRT